MPTEWTDAELDLLSAYIDEQLDDSERTALDARLAQDADLRQELASMRQTVALLHSLPTIRAPRAFTLTPEMVGQTAVPAMVLVQPRAAESKAKVRPMRRVWWIPAASAAGVVLLAGVLLLTQTNIANAPLSGAVAVLPTATPTIVLSGSNLNTVILDVVTVVPATAITMLPPVIKDSNSQTEQNIYQSSAAQPQTPPVTETLRLSEAPEDQVSSDDQESDGAVGSVPVPPLVRPIPTEEVQIQEQVSDIQPQEPEPRQGPTLTPELLLDAAFGAPPAQGTNLDASSGGGGTGPLPGGMDGVNLNPDTPGFSVATMSSDQITQVAMYSVAGSNEVTVFGSTDVSVESAPAITAKREPIWIRWVNTLSEWFQMLFARN